MPPADPSQWLINPYANDGAPESSSARSARAAGRALAVGALGLGAAAVFTGTGLADEENGGGGSTSEVEEFDSSSAGDDSSVDGGSGGASELVAEDDRGSGRLDGGSGGGSELVAEDDRGSGRLDGGSGSQLIASSLDDGSGDRLLTLPPLDAPAGSGDADPEADWTGVDELEQAGGIQEFDAGSPEFQAVSDLLQDIESGDAEFGTSADLGPLDREASAPTTQLNTTGNAAQSETLRVAEQVIALTPPERAAIDTQRTQMARLTPDPVTGDIVATVPASTGEAEEVAIAPNVTWRGPTVNTGDAEIVFRPQESEIGVENLSSNGGQVVYTPPQLVRPLDERGNARVALGTTITGTLNPQSGQSIYLSGGGDPVDPADRLNIQTATTASASMGTGRPEEAPTGDASARWDTLALTGGLNTNLDLTNGENNVVPSGSVSAPVALTLDAGENNPNSRWDATASVGATPQFTFAPDAGVDPQLDLTAQVGAGGEIGDRRDGDGNFYDTDGDGLTPGSVAWGRLGGQWQSTTSGVVPLTAATGETVNVPGNTSSHNLGGELGFRLREDQPRLTADVTGSVGAGIQGSSANTEYGSMNTGTTPYVNAALDGSVQARTAPRDQSHLFAGADANLGFTSANGESATSASITPQVGGRLALGSSAITADGGYRLGTNPGPTVGVGGEFNLFGGRAAPEVRYTGGENSAVAVNLNFTPGAAVRAPEPPPLQQIDPPAAPAVIASGPAETATNTTANSTPLSSGADLSFGTSPAPADLPPIPRGVTGAAALEGTVPRGIELTPAPSVSPQSSLPATPEIGPRSAAPTPDEGLNISLDKSVVDIPSPTVSSLPDPSPSTSSASLSSVPDLSPPAPSVSLPDLTPEASPALALAPPSIDPPSVSAPSLDTPSFSAPPPVDPPSVSTPSIDPPSSSLSSAPSASVDLPSGFGSFTSRF